MKFPVYLTALCAWVHNRSVKLRLGYKFELAMFWAAVALIVILIVFSLMGFPKGLMH